MTRSEMIDAARKVFAMDGTEDEINVLVYNLKLSAPHSKISDMIFYPDVERDAEQVVDEALRREKEYAERANAQ